MKFPAIFLAKRFVSKSVMKFITFWIMIICLFGVPSCTKQTVQKIEEEQFGLALSSSIVYNEDVETKLTYPKIAGLYIGNHNYEDPIYRAAIAKNDVAILGFWEGWRPQFGGIRTAVQEIKKLNPSILLAKYTVLNEASNNPNNTSKLHIYNKLFAGKGPNGKFDWWARDTSGNNVGSYSGTWNINITSYVTPDASGMRYPEWIATQDNKNFFEPVPEFDIWYFDNVFFKPRVIADWNGDGINDSYNDPEVRRIYREAMVDEWKAAKHLQPKLIQMGNVEGNALRGEGLLSEAEYLGKLGGAFMEAAMGAPYSLETWSTWDNMNKSYDALIKNTRSPHMVLFHVKGQIDDYSFMRYALASALMNNGYFVYTDVMKGYGGVAWFDEFDLDLGKAVDAPQLTAIANGVFKRKFENGLAIVNPKGNGTQTISIEPGYKRFLGIQDPATNNGLPVTSITLKEREGIILIKEETTSSIN